jgi:25S rRNA (adenine2142-N1)-methyltransferase
MAKKRKAVPLAPPVLKSRKKARHVTTAFHKLTRQRDAAQLAGDSEQVQILDQSIQEMGGREEYQRASQVSVSFHSTSKWVLGYLSRNGWLYGVVPNEGTSTRRPTRLLEVGAISTELLDAAKRTELKEGSEVAKNKYRLQVRAIDLHAMHEGIEEADFLEIPIPTRKVEARYDVVVCSMVINCVTTPEQRGEMLCRLFHFLRPDGLCFLTLPKGCLTLSPFVDTTTFRKALETVGFDIVESKDSPKVSFYVLKRPTPSTQQQDSNDASIAKWSKIKAGKRGKKYRNDFSLILTKEGVAGDNLTYAD